MRVIGFLGGYDKADMLIYVARTLALAKQKVLLVDATTNQKARYIVPSITPTRTYVTEFKGFDVAVGFNNMNGIKEYLGYENKPLEYDIALLDIDTPEMFDSFDSMKNYKNCFVTAFDLYSLKRGLEILSGCTVPTKLTKVLFSAKMTKEENEYLDYLALGYKIKWDETILNFPIELGNYNAIVESQTVSRIKIKKLSNHYKESLMYLLDTVFNEIVPSKELSKALKLLEKEA